MVSFSCVKIKFNCKKNYLHISLFIKRTSSENTVNFILFFCSAKFRFWIFKFPFLSFVNLPYDFIINTDFFLKRNFVTPMIFKKYSKLVIPSNFVITLYFQNHQTQNKFLSQFKYSHRKENTHLLFCIWRLNFVFSK